MSVHAPSKPRPVRHAQAKGERVARSSGFEGLARAGFVSRGVIYGLIGILAIKLALGNGGSQASQQGALRTIARQPFGKVLLILVAIGLAGYALWRIIHVLLGHGPERSDSTFDSVVLDAATKSFADAGQIFPKLIQALVMSDAFRKREDEQAQ